MMYQELANVAPSIPWTPYVAVVVIQSNFPVAANLTRTDVLSNHGFW